MMFWLGSVLLGVALAQDPSVPVDVEAQLAEARAELERVQAELAGAVASAEQARASAADAEARLEAAQAEVVFLEQVSALWGAEDDSAIRALAATRDPRALVPLSAMVEWRRPAVASVAAEVLYQVPGSVPKLIVWSREEGLALEVRVAAASSLARTQTPEAGDALVRLSKSREAPNALRQHAAELVRSYYPERLGEVPAATDGSPTPWLIGGGAYMLGHDLGMLGALGQSDLQALGVVAGGAGGAAGGWVLGRSQDLSAADAAFLSVNGSVSTIAGTVLGSTASGEQAPWVGGFLAQAGGIGASLALRKQHDGTALDSVEAAGLGLTTGGLVLLISDQVGANVREVRSDTKRRAVGTSILAGTTLGHVVAPRLDLRAETLRLSVLTAGYGAALGALSPMPLNNAFGREFSRQGLTPLGAGLGLVGGYVGGHVVEIDDATTAAGALGFVHGAALGLGTAGLLQLDERPYNAMVLAGITGGLAGGVALGATGGGELTQNDTLLMALVSGWSAYQGAGWLAYADGRPSEPGPSARHWFLVVPTTVSLGGAVATRYVEVPPIYVVSSASLGVWGGYLGASVAVFADKEVLGPVLVGSDLGLAAGLALGHPKLGASPMVVGLADAGGVLGGSVAALLLSFGTSDTKTILTGSLVGAAGGFAGGAVLGSRLEARDADVRIGRLHLPDLPGRGFLAPAAMPTESGVAYGVTVGRVGF